MMREDTANSQKNAEAPIEAARESVRLLYEAEIRLCERRLQMASRLPGARREAGRRALAAMLQTARPSGGRDNLVAMQSELAALDAAITEGRSQRAEKILLVFKGEALALHDQAAEIRKTAEDRQAVTDAMLARLQEHEGCRYAPAVPFHPWSSSDRAQLAGPVIVSVEVPRTQLLCQEADALEARSRQLMERQVPAAGHIADVAGIDALLDAIRAWDALTMAPRLDHAAEWAERAVAGVQARLDQLIDRNEAGGVEVLLTFAWKNGTIDPRESYSRLAVPPRPAPARPVARWTRPDGSERVVSTVPVP